MQRFNYPPPTAPSECVVDHIAPVPAFLIYSRLVFFWPQEALSYEFSSFIQQMGNSCHGVITMKVVWLYNFSSDRWFSNLHWGSVIVIGSFIYIPPQSREPLDYIQYYNRILKVHEFKNYMKGKVKLRSRGLVTRANPLVLGSSGEVELVLLCRKFLPWVFRSQTQNDTGRDTAFLCWLLRLFPLDFSSPLTLSLEELHESFHVSVKDERNPGSWIEVAFTNQQILQIFFEIYVLRCLPWVYKILWKSCLGINTWNPFKVPGAVSCSVT